MKSQLNVDTDTSALFGDSTGELESQRIFNFEFMHDCNYYWSILSDNKFHSIERKTITNEQIYQLLRLFD